MKRYALSLLLACLGLAAPLLVISLTACVDTSRQPRTAKSQLPEVYTVELRSDHGHYEFGEAVHLRVTLTNVSKMTVVFGSETGTIPVLDIEVKTPGSMQPSEREVETRTWAQEHPDQVKYLVSLVPGQSYVVEWALTLSLRSNYAILAQWIDPRVNERFGTGVSIDNGFRDSSGAP